MRTIEYRDRAYTYTCDEYHLSLAADDVSEWRLEAMNKISGLTLKWKAKEHIYYETQASFPGESLKQNDIHDIERRNSGEECFRLYETHLCLTPTAAVSHGILRHRGGKSEPYYYTTHAIFACFMRHIISHMPRALVAYLFIFISLHIHVWNKNTGNEHVSQAIAFIECLSEKYCSVFTQEYIFETLLFIIYYKKLFSSNGTCFLYSIHFSWV